MAHFVELDSDNNVINVIGVNDSDCLDADGKESEAVGIQWLKDFYGDQSRIFLQCSYNANIRKKHPGVGYTYDPDLDVFVPPQPYPSWVYNADSGDWDAPTPRPDESGGTFYTWDEDSVSWVVIDVPVEGE